MQKQKIEGGLKLRGAFKEKPDPGLPLVSIITVCLNSGKYLEQTILSVINQTYDNIEYIIVDGGSTDKTLNIIRKYEEYIEYWVSEPDKGIYDAINKGISFADGEWIGIINSDDFYVKDAVKSVVEASGANKEAQIFYGNLKMLNSREYRDLCDCREHKGRISNILENFELNHPTCFVSKEIYAKLKFSNRFKCAADWEFFRKLYSRGVKFGYINKLLAYQRPGGISYSFLASFECCRLRKKYASKTAFRWLCLSIIKRASDIFDLYWQKILKAFFNDDRQHNKFLFDQKCKAIAKIFWPKT